MKQKKKFDIKEIMFLNQEKEKVVENIMFAIFILFLVFVSSKKYYIFHTSVEITIAMIAFGTFIVSVNTYKICKNDFFMFLGIGYSFVGILDLMHAFSYENFNIFPGASLNMVGQFWIAARLLELGTLLVSSVFIYKKFEQPDFILIFILFLSVFTFLVMSIMYFKIFPECRIEGMGLTKFKIVMEYFISTGLCVTAWIFYKARKRIDKSLFYHLQASIIFTALCEIIFILYKTDTDFANISGHVLKVISFYFLYRAIIGNRLQRPFDKLIFELDETDIRLKEEEKQRIFLERVISQNEQYYDLIINNSKDAIIVQSGGEVVFANTRAAGIIGAENSSELVGRTLMEFVHMGYLLGEDECIRTAADKKVQLPFVDFEITNLKGKKINIEASTIYILYFGKPAVLTIFRDISCRKKIENLENNVKENEERLNASKEFIRVQTEFFTNISHELKTPLNVILSAIQLLRLPNNELYINSSNEKLNSLIGVMGQNCYRLLRLINNFIDISKIDAGHLKLQMANYNIVSVIEDISLSVVKYFENKEVELIFDTDTEEKEMAIDVDKIERIMLNLLSNAIKFTNKGDKTMVSIQDKGYKVLISVKDTGVGIPENKLDIIFDRFGQVDKTLTRQREGSGVGLALVKNLVELHGGTIEVRSKVSEGSEFIIELPVKIVEEEMDNDAFLYHSNIEKINIEFSDIYAS